MISPFRVSSQPCSFFPCGQNADMDILDKGARLCREHALFVWSIVQEQIAGGTLSPQDEAESREREQAEKAAEFERICGPRPGHVYYLRVGEHVKIGYAADLARRLKSYPPGTELLAVETGTMELERNRHLQFADLRAAGREWYWPEPRLLDHIEVIASDGLHLETEDDEWKKRAPKSVANPDREYVGGRHSLGVV